MATRKRNSPPKNKTNQGQVSAPPGHVEGEPDQQQKSQALKQPDQRPAIYSVPTIGNVQSAPEAESDAPGTPERIDIDETWHRAGGAPTDNS